MYDPFPFSLEGFYESLCRLTERTDDDDFVILKDKESGNFVQFGRGPDLILDLPLAALNDEEVERAYTFFRSLGVEEPVDIEAPDSFHSSTTQSHKVFQYNFGRKARPAAQTAIDLFNAVYGPLPFSRLRTSEI